MAKRGTTKFKSNKQEYRVAEEVGGFTQIGSGCLLDKADVKSESFLIECKTTKEKNYQFLVTTWIKIKREALKLGKCPVLYIDLGDNYKETMESIIVMREQDFASYMGDVSGREVMIVKRSVKLLAEDAGKNIKIPFIGDLVVVSRKEFFELLEVVHK